MFQLCRHNVRISPEKHDKHEGIYDKISLVSWCSHTQTIVMLAVIKSAKYFCSILAFVVFIIILFKTTTTLTTVH